MARVNITYEKVSEIIQKLQREGLKPSLRLVRSELGAGSYKTLLEFMQRWTSENSLANIAGVELSDAFKQSLLAELGRVAKTTREQYEEKLAAEKDRADEMLGLMGDFESRIAELEQINVKEKADRAAEALAFQKRIATLEEKSAEQLKQIEKMENSLKSAIAGQEAARTEAATAKLELKRSDEATAKAEKEALAMREKAEKFQQQAHDSQIELAALKARLDEIQKSKNLK